jgi:acetylornithine deacetylase
MRSNLSRDPLQPPSDVVEMARALVATPSVNPELDPDGSGESEIAALAAAWLAEWGFTVETAEFATGRSSVTARLERGTGRTLLLAGHLDTVGVQDMTIEPFDPVVRDGRLYGRGAADMKGGVAAILAAARELAADAGFHGTLVVCLTADEEHAGRGCRQVVDAGTRADAAIVCEPTGMAIMPAHKGFAWIQIDFHGQAAHGSRPERGVDAIRHAGVFLARLDELEARLAQRKRHPLLGSGSIHAGTIHGGTAPSVYPSHCRLTLERRTLPGESPATARSDVDYLLAQLRSDVPSLDAELEVTLSRDGSELPGDHEIVITLSRSLSDADIEPAVKGMSAWVEASIYNAAGIPTVTFGPGDIADAHTADESVAVADLEAAHRVLVSFVRRFLS